MKVLRGTGAKGWSQTGEPTKPHRTIMCYTMPEQSSCFPSFVHFIKLTIFGPWNCSYIVAFFHRKNKKEVVKKLEGRKMNAAHQKR